MLLRRHRRAREGRQTTSEVAAPAEAEAKPYDKRKNDDLRAELEARGLDSSGKKAELVARLEADDAAKAAADQGEPENPDVPEGEQSETPEGEGDESEEAGESEGESEDDES